MSLYQRFQDDRTNRSEIIIVGSSIDFDEGLIFSIHFLHIVEYIFVVLEDHYHQNNKSHHVSHTILQPHRQQKRTKEV